MNSTLKIAYYGFVKKGAGSGSGGQFLILEELLKRGVQIDFYGWKGFTEPTELLTYPNFCYIPLSDTAIVRFAVRLIPPRLHKSFFTVFSPLLINRLNRRVIQREISEHHATKKYDLLFFVELCSPFKVEGLPTISWLQGSPQTEWFFIQKARKTIVSLCGIGLYLKLAVLYRLKARQAKKEISYSDILICGSSWSKEQLIQYGVTSEVIKILPYPLDMNLFKFTKTRADSSTKKQKVFLYLGRVDPRKRLDLLLAAYALVLQERQDVKLKIIGGMSYVKGYHKLIDNFAYPDYLEYQSSIERSQVPELMASCDVLIQPSEGENFGSSVAEALCIGLPAIVGSTNGTKDFIDPSFVFEEYSPECLKQVMLEALNKIEENQEAIALKGRRTAEQNFNVSHVVNRLQDVFQEAQALSAKPQNLDKAQSRITVSTTQNLGEF